jgi:hypothetical protein
MSSRRAFSIAVLLLGALSCESGENEAPGDTAGAGAGGTSSGAGAGTTAGTSSGGKAGNGAAGHAQGGASGVGGSSGAGGNAAGAGGSGRGGTGGGGATGGGVGGNAGNAAGIGGGAGVLSGGAGSANGGTGGDAAGNGGTTSGGSGMSGMSGSGGSGGSEPVTYDWVLTAFTNESESNMFVYHSDNGTNFDLVKGPAYTPPGSQLVRDPSVMLHDDGRYYLVYTTGWREDNFGIAHSTDLETWTFLTTVPTLSNATSSWAPEWYVDDGAIHVIISISTTGNGDAFGTFTPHLFTAESDDLQSWDSGRQMTGITPNYIDTFVVRAGSTYHAFTKNENTKIIEHATASALTGPYTFVGTGDWAGWGNTAVEGPCLFQLEDGTWRMLVDGYTSSQYLYSDSEDLTTWSQRRALPGGLSGFIRHGTVLRRSVSP